MRVFFLSVLLLLPQMESTAAAQKSQDTEVEEQVRLRRVEAGLLHRRVDLSGVRLVAGKRWRRAAPPPADALLVNVWATTCGPCKIEMPLLARMVERFQRDRPQGLGFAFISEDEEGALRAFLGDPKNPVPRAKMYQNASGRLRAVLQDDRQPMTLLLDRQGIVRQAFAGSLAERRQELVSAIEGLLHGVRGHGREPAPLRTPQQPVEPPGPAKGPPSWEDALAYLSIEASLLHRGLYENNLYGWVPKLRDWSERPPAKAGYSLVSIWPPGCKDCLPQYLRLRRIAERSFPRVRFFAIAQGTKQAELQADLTQADARLQQGGCRRLEEGEFFHAPEGVMLVVHDQTGRPRLTRPGNVDPRLQDLQGTPMLLLLDGQMVIRQALLGPLQHRAAELAAGLERLSGLGPRGGQRAADRCQLPPERT